MGRYERGDDAWTITRDGSTITQTAPDGAIAVEGLPSLAIAAARFNVLINQRARDGWKLVKPVAAAAGVSPPPIVYDARNPELEHAIVANPEADEAYLIYGDWLQQQGDPRGELIARQSAAAANPTDLALAALVKSRLRVHRDYFYGSIRPQAGQVVTFKWGFIHSIKLRAVRPGSLEEILTNASARFVVSIEIDDDRQELISESLRVIGEVPTLRMLVLVGNVWLRDLDAIGPRLSSLRRLTLDTKLSIGTCLDTLIATPFPHLESLVLQLLDGDSTERLHRLVRRDLPRLVELRARAAIRCCPRRRARTRTRRKTPRVAVAARARRCRRGAPDRMPPELPATVEAGDPVRPHLGSAPQGACRAGPGPRHQVTTASRESS